MNGRRHMVDEEALFAASDFPIPPQDPCGRFFVLNIGGVAFERAPFLVKVCKTTDHVVIFAEPLSLSL